LKKEHIQLLVARNENGESKFAQSNQFGLFPWSPSWGEINYFAFNYPTIEFHDELYGYLQEVAEKYKIDEFDEYLSSKGIAKNKEWIKELNGQPQAAVACTLPTFIRNKIHHPENQTMNNANFSIKELEDSILSLIKLCKDLKDANSKRII
jgi:hypothetical protein